MSGTQSNVDARGARACPDVGADETERWLGPRHLVLMAADSGG